MKKATTIDEQIALLRERGMTIERENKAREVLLNTGYYRLGFYWYPFEKDVTKKNRTHLFKEGTDFKEVVTLQRFDHMLRAHLTLFLQGIEQSIRTRIIYHASHYYKEFPTWYMHPKYISASFRSDFESKYKALCRRVEVLSKHHKKYPNDLFAPAWKALEFATFGDLTALYDALREEEVQKTIALSFGIKNARTFSRYIHALRILRNRCAHGENVYDMSLPVHLPLKPIRNVSSNNRTNLGGILCVMNHFYNHINAFDAKAFKETFFDFLRDAEDMSEYLCDHTFLDFLKD